MDWNDLERLCHYVTTLTDEHLTDTLDVISDRASSQSKCLAFSASTIFSACLAERTRRYKGEGSNLLRFANTGLDVLAH